MGTKTTWALVVAASAVTGTGAVRAQDAERPTTTRGSIVLPVGDKVHGYMRGGETHALQVHLAKGDVYSFDVNSNKRGDPLKLHLELIDPSGREVTGDARVAYRREGKRVTMGPYVAPASGTYVIELSAQSWFSGDYWGTSSVRGARKSVVRLPAGGTTVEVNVSAGSTLRLRAPGVVRNFVMATPNAPTSELSGKDPLVASLRGRGLAASETGTYQFGAKGAATIEVTKPRWKAAVVEAPTLPDDPTRLAQFDWVFNGWKEQNAAASPHPLEMLHVQVSPSPSSPVVGAPAAVGLSTGAGTTASLFLGGGIDAIGDTSHIHEMPPSNGNAGTPPPLPRPPLLSPPNYAPYVPQPSAPFEEHILPPATEFGTPARLQSLPLVPTINCRAWAGTSAFGANWSGWRDTPWNRVGPGPVVSSAVSARLLPWWNELVAVETDDAEFGFGPDPFIRRTFKYPQDERVAGSYVTTSRYFVDGHQVSAMLATGGELVVAWTVAGSGTIDGVAWTVNGEWTMRVWTPALAFAARPPQVCLVSGNETYEFASGLVTESIVTGGVTMDEWRRDSVLSFLFLGTIGNGLSAPSVGIFQTTTREVRPVVGYSQTDNAIPIRATTKTIDPSTDGEPVEDATEFLYLYWTWC